MTGVLIAVTCVSSSRSHMVKEYALSYIPKKGEYLILDDVEPVLCGEVYCVLHHTAAEKKPEIWLTLSEVEYGTLYECEGWQSRHNSNIF